MVFTKKWEMTTMEGSNIKAINVNLKPERSLMTLFVTSSPCVCLVSLDNLVMQKLEY